MASPAIGAESRRFMAGSCCLRVGLGVARETVGREAPELSYRCSLVARIALQDGVRPNQREPVEVLARLLYRHLPALHRVALFAIRSKLPLVNIGVAIRALRSGIGKNRARMALHARDLLVHAQQRELRLVVIEFGLAANRLPAREGVAVVAGHVQRPVRTP